MPEREILIDRSPGEVRAAILVGGRLEQFLVERAHAPWLAGSLILARVVSVRPELSAVFVDLGGREGYLEGTKDKQLTEGAVVLVEVVAEATEAKAVRVSSDITLVGSLTTLTPRSSVHSIARRITAKTERAHFHEILNETLPEGVGATIRAEARGRDTSSVRADVKALAERWSCIQNRIRTGEIGTVEPSLGLLGLGRRLAVEAVVTEGRDGVLFRERGVDGMVEAALARRVELPSGGALTFDEAEALTAIDVDTAQSRSALRDFSELAREASERIVWEIRLRRLAGLIVADFPRSRRPKFRTTFEEGLKKAFTASGAERANLHGWTRGGLFEITRPRQGPSLRGELYREGAPNPETLALEALRVALRESVGIARPRLICPNAVRLALMGPLGGALAATNRRLGGMLKLEVGPDGREIRVDGG